MNKIFYVLGTITVGVGIYFLIFPSQQIKNPLKSEINQKETKKDELNLVNINNKNLLNNEKLQKDTFTQTNKLKDEKNINISKKIANFIGNNNLISIQKIGDVEVLAPNYPNKNEFAPPVTPTLVKLKFKDKDEIISLNSNLINSNNKIYVVEKKGDEYKAIKVIDTKKLNYFTPPGIGQN